MPEYAVNEQRPTPGLWGSRVALCRALYCEYPDAMQGPSGVTLRPLGRRLTCPIRTSQMWVFAPNLGGLLTMHTAFPLISIS